MSPSPGAGSRIGPDEDPDRYVVGAPVAAGAEGILFRGWLTRAGVEAEVAIKMLQPRLLDRVDDWHELWTDQVQLLLSLRTPGVVTVREGFLGALPHPPGEVAKEQTLYLVMNWVDGESLDEWVRRRPDRDPFEALNLLLGVATALDLMHSGHFTRNPVVHRDVKPANILVTDEGTVLVDFGLTRALPDGPRLSGIAGTLGYLAPEATDAGEYTPATDRYALGAVAYFIFTGREPPTSHQSDALRASLQAVPALRDRPDAVDHLMAMLATDPEARPHPLSNWVGQVRRSTLDDPSGVPPAAAVTPSAARGPAQGPEEVKGALSKLAHTLVSVENGDLAVVRAQATGRGRMAQAALRIIALADEVWLGYPLVKEVGDRLVALGSSDGRGAGRLLGPAAITRPDGSTTGAAAMIADLQRQIDEVAAEAATLAGTALEALSHLRAAEAKVQDLHTRAATIGAGDDDALRSALQGVGDAEAALTRDLAGPSDDLVQAVIEAGSRVQHLEEVCSTLPERLVRAMAELAEIEKLVDMGGEAFANAEEKILEPQGLRAPLDPSRLDDGDKALRPWLAEIEGDAARRRWRAADGALNLWLQEASALRDEAAGICDANRPPVAERNELRGLFDCYQKIAASKGMAELSVIIPLHDDADATLYTAPCDLASARRKVRAYMDAVNRCSSKDRR